MFAKKSWKSLPENNKWAECSYFIGNFFAVISDITSIMCSFAPEFSFTWQISS